MGIRRFILFMYLSILSSYSSLYSQKFKDSLLLRFQTTIHFNSAQSTILKDERIKLDSIISNASKIKPYRIQIYAHTDKQGRDMYNYNLSQDRANSIQKYLIKKGIRRKLINSNFFGESKPIVDGKNAKSRRLNRRGIVKLFKIQKFVSIKGIVTDDKGNFIPEANIELLSGNLKDYFKSDSFGKFKTYSPLDKDIIVTATAKDFFYKSTKIKRKDIINLKMIKLIIPRIKEDEKFIAKNLLFYGSRCNLRHSSYNELKHIQTSIKLNTDLCFEIAGHINGPYLPKSKKGSFEFELSVSRALTIYDSLISYGINKNRLLAKGYGNWFMIYPKTRDEKKMRFNRRVELVVKDCSLIQKSENDILSQNYIFSVFNERFSPKNLKESLSILTKSQKTKVLKTLRALKAKDENPEKFNYKELLDYKN